MNLEEQFKSCQKLYRPAPAEEKISETIQKSAYAFYEARQELLLSPGEFLRIQLKLIRKRWWLLQFLLLCAAGAMLASPWEENQIQRGMAVCSTLFSILTIPELWKNRSCQSMEIEKAALYSLRQIYAARILLFGIADILLLTLFGGTAVLGLRFPPEQLLIQFLLPVTVTSAICFGTLSSRHKVTESSAIVLSVLWSALWLLITLNEQVYRMISLPAWAGIFGASLLLLCLTVIRTLDFCDEYLEIPK